ncbi:MAG TPA: carboxypeptidase regulatory-like domain-containing protein [Kofleriaceae bacterium]|nr:carboxypeptidase regulatory-like domain-containing protein [Kofleriaceae bacterium]
MIASWKSFTASALGALVACSAALACHPGPEADEALETSSAGAIGGPIHGYVATTVIAGGQDRAAATGGGVRFNVPNILVWAKSTTTSTMSPKVATNAAGYFHTPVVPPGQYHMCVSGAGFAQRCETEVVTIAGRQVELDHVVLIAPVNLSISGTVLLKDNKTPCFWFRPAFDTNAVTQAKVSLTDTAGNLVAGPIKGNSLGQYVLPVGAAPGTYTLSVTCDASGGGGNISLGTAPLHVDLSVGNSPPQIAAVNLTKGGAGVRRADPGDVLRATVTTSDPDGDTLSYKWTDDSGRSLGLPDAPSVDWKLLGDAALNTLRVQVSDGKGGFAVSSRGLFGGPNELLFAGTVTDRLTGAPVDKAQVTLNLEPTVTDARGQFQVRVPDAERFVLNIRKKGYALSSRIYYGRNTGLRIPLDRSTTRPLDAGKGGVVSFPCDQRGDKTCETGVQLNFPGGVLADSDGKVYTGAATIEAFQYDTTLMNPIPGDQGARYQGKTVRLSTYGSVFIQPRDAGGKPLQMVAGKTVPMTMPIEAQLQAGAPPTIPLFRYDEDTGMWLDIGTLTRSGNRFEGEVDHFSAFNADTQFAGSACLKVILDPSFTLPVYLDAVYTDPASGTFYHNNTQVTDNPIGIERMTPNVSFTLNVRDGIDNHLLKSVSLLSGPGLDPALFPDGLVTDPNFDACNGPVTVYNDAVLPTGPTYLMPITGGSITDNSVAYRTATNADPGGSRDTLDHWKSANGFGGAESTAIYFNAGDLKFGRNMHCRVTASGTTACYVSNYGVVGTDDDATALAAARAAGTPVATVTMEYDPAATGDHNVQFWAYKGDGSYLAKAALDGQGAKPLPDICLACHYGYMDATNTVAIAQFLPFDVASFHYDTDGDPHAGSLNATTVQEQFRQLNKMVLDTTATAATVQPGYTQLMNLWYPGGVGTAGQLFSFTRTAANLTGTPFSGGHEPLYDNVVAPVCRTCHISHGSSDNWTSFGQMNAGGTKLQIQSYACGKGSPGAQQTQSFAMPHAEVPFKKFWSDSLASTLSSQLTLAAPGCPNN